MEGRRGTGDAARLRQGKTEVKEPRKVVIVHRSVEPPKRH